MKHDDRLDILTYTNFLLYKNYGQKLLDPYARVKIIYEKEKKQMNSETFEAIIQEQIKRCTDILCNKAKEYASDTDRLHNFKAAAGMTGQDPKTALLGMWMKHLVSVSDMCQSGKHYPMDMWNEKLTDTINYALLLKALVVEESENYLENQTVRSNDIGRRFTPEDVKKGGRALQEDRTGRTVKS